jgi:proline dehydrogenase
MRADRAILFKLATNERFEQLVKALPGGEQGAYRAASLATHDGRLREAVLLSTDQGSVEQLFGVRPEALDDLLARAVPTRVYLPYGPDWFRYWLRRIAESRGA